MKKLFILLLGLLFVSNGIFANPIGVVVSIEPLAEFVNMVGKDLVDVSVMIPTGASPHSYEPTPKQMRNLGNAKLYVKVGSGIEFELSWLDKILEINSNLSVCDSSQGITLMKTKQENHQTQNIHECEDCDYDLQNESKKGYDPHIWLSIDNAIKMVRNIRICLSKLDPINKDTYLANSVDYIMQLKAVKKELNEIFTQKQTKKFLVKHPSWGYFARDFGLEQISIEIEGKEPSAKDLMKIIKQAKKNNIKIVFTSPQFSKKSAQSIAKEIKGKVLMIDPLARNYLENMKTVGKKLAQ